MDADKWQITRFPAPVLQEPARPVEEITEEIRRLVERMVDVMIEYKGVGLAAPQIGVNLRVFIVSVDGARENVNVYINPEIKVSGELEAHEEGCLSIPGVYANVKRYKKCTITATDLDGQRFSREARGLEVRAFQHEYDHLEGTLIKDRMGQVQLISARKQLRHLREKYEENRQASGA
ncbi:MAG: peptide deformylase [Phycisphaerae bacterium]|nr:peptide deformylase [Phycisphaerae bacterium]